MRRHFISEKVFIILLLVNTTAIAAPAQTLTTLASFNSGEGAPYGSLTQGLDGGLYGTTYEGGANGYGAIFEITTAGTLTTFYSFCAQANCADGSWPYGGLVLGADGNFYGTTEYGGANGSGTVYMITPGGALTTLYSFCSQAGCTDGELPYAGLVQGTNGNFYGTTPFGGADGQGTVFEITPAGTLTTFYSFCAQTSCTDGANPYAGLVQGTNGNFYGTAYDGGHNAFGTVFKMTAGGTLTTIRNFAANNGNFPFAGLVLGSDGNFYGTTTGFGSRRVNDPYGTVYRITPGGKPTVLHFFADTDGAYPSAGMVQATDANFYGTTPKGGANDNCSAGCGTVFEITLGGTFTTLYNFCEQTGCADGSSPQAALMQATNGNLYGTTLTGGANGAGTVFTLSTGLGPFLETLPTFGKVGAPVIILGTDLTGATSVTFNGTAATFTVVSSSEITTTVPKGATTGTVQVTTPSGVLSSNVGFRLMK